jgi:hypothetical protein
MKRLSIALTSVGVSIVLFLSERGSLYAFVEAGGVGNTWLRRKRSLTTKAQW